MADPPVVRGIVREGGNVVFDLIGPHSIQIRMLDYLDASSVELHADAELRNPKYGRLNQDDESPLRKLSESQLDRFGCHVIERDDPSLGKALNVRANQHS